MSVGDAALIRLGLPWTLVSLLVLAITAHLWGIRPALLVLALSATYGVAVVPYLFAISFRPERPLSAFDAALVLRTLVFCLCGAAVIGMIYRTKQMQARAERRREVVTTLRSMILPETLAEAPGYDISGIYKPARREEEVGGDFYDFYPIEEGVYGLLIGDVMGKGKEAAAFTALLRYTARAFASRGMRPPEMLSELNHLIDSQRLPFGMASLFLGILDTRTQMLRYANAGHEPPMLRRNRGAEENLETTGPILGTGLSVTYEERSLTLHSGDALFLFTDGVTEARDPQRNFLQREGTWAFLFAALKMHNASAALHVLDSSLTDFTANNASDDIAMVLLRRA